MTCQSLSFQEHCVERFARVKLTAEHNRLNRARVMNVGERILVEQNKIGSLANFNGSAAVELPHKLGGITRGGLESGKRR